MDQHWCQGITAKVGLVSAGSVESTSTSTVIENTEDNQATVYQTNRISNSFGYVFGPKLMVSRLERHT